MSPTKIVRHISECFVQPKDAETLPKQPIYLSPWDLARLSVHYNQKGLLFCKPLTADGEEDSINSLLERLKQSPSLALVPFYPLAGRLATLKQENPKWYSVYIDCNNSPGARFIHAAVDLSISDILSPLDVPSVVQSFFDNHKAVNHDGHIAPLLTVQITELLDGIFIGCSINHMLVDGTSHWHFVNTWSKIFREGGKSVPISLLPFHKRWFPEGIKSKANAECNSTNVSSLQCKMWRKSLYLYLVSIDPFSLNYIYFQSLSAVIWRCVTQVLCLSYDQQMSCKLAINNRSQLVPPLPTKYFGNYIQAVKGTATSDELLSHNLVWATLLLHQAVVEHNDTAIRRWSQFSNSCDIMVGSTPRFDLYGNEFGMGKVVAVLSRHANKFNGKVILYPGFEGGGSMDFEVCLSPESMVAIESGKEFMSALNLAKSSAE
ncbi:Quinate O-hydroxycinnamoyltransferase [Bertholletia excelsa]